MLSLLMSTRISLVSLSWFYSKQRRSTSQHAIIKVCRCSRRPFCFCFVFCVLLRSARLCRQTFMFLFCLLCIIIIIILSSALSSDISVIYYPISLKFGQLLVLNEETKWYDFQPNLVSGRDRAWSHTFTILYNRKTLYTARRDKNFT